MSPILASMRYLVRKEGSSATRAGAGAQGLGRVEAKAKARVRRIVKYYILVVGRIGWLVDSVLVTSVRSNDY